jgi:hypothetical protein
MCTRTYLRFCKSSRGSQLLLTDQKVGYQVQVHQNQVCLVVLRGFTTAPQTRCRACFLLEANRNSGSRAVRSEPEEGVHNRPEVLCQRWGLWPNCWTLFFRRSFCTRQNLGGGQTSVNGQRRRAHPKGHSREVVSEISLKIAGTGPNPDLGSDPFKHSAGNCEPGITLRTHWADVGINQDARIRLAT